MARDKPRDHLLLPLMKSTFYARRMSIQNDEQPLAEFLRTFKALKCISVVSTYITYILFVPQYAFYYYYGVGRQLFQFLYRIMQSDSFYLN